ncbi:IclR family transcriptional regulator domain-containing protein [Nocardia miyunensis]|uniref:IclR family transcriptional regulator domain-containing protein n=1 Tax=Nocardia miyunensis TaxID=282684 RepID=UPI003F775062
MPRYRLDALLPDSRLPTLTKKSVGSTARLLEELDQVREQGYAIDDEESEVGLRAVAVRVVHSNLALSVDAALTVAGPEVRMTDERIQWCLTEIHKLMGTELA